MPLGHVLVLSMHDDPAYLRSVLASGASGYVTKRAIDTELLAAIRAVHRGGVFIDPSLAHVFVQDVLDKPATANGPSRSLNILSERERQVLGLVAQGYGTQEIAKQLLVSGKRSRRTALESLRSWDYEHAMKSFALRYRWVC